MKKTILLISTLFLILINGILFLIPSSFNSLFWVMYGVLHFNVLLNLIILCKQKDKPHRYGLEIKLTSIICLEFISVLIFKFVKTDKVWISILLGLIFLCLYVGLFILMNNAHKYTENIDDNLMVNKISIEQIKLELRLMMEKAEDNVKSKLIKLYGKLVDSDPISISEVKDIEEELTNKILQLKENDFCEELFDEINSLLIKRNETLKLHK